jgi:two-component system sensor histidine kinase TctE
VIGWRSLRGRLLSRLALVLAVLLALGSTNAYWNARSAADTAYDRSLLSSARAIAERLFDSDGQLFVDVPYIALDNFAYDITGRLYYQVINLTGSRFPVSRICPAPRLMSK